MLVPASTMYFAISLIMVLLALKALDLMAELDRTVLQCINMSGLYRTIWEEIAQKAERSRSETLEALKQRTQFSPNTEMREQQLTEIFTAAQDSAWDTIRNCVNWLIAEVRSRNTITTHRLIDIHSRQHEYRNNLFSVGPKPYHFPSDRNVCGFSHLPDVG